MTNIQTYTTLRLTWEQVTGYIGNLISALLGRDISCHSQTEDGDYWSISAIKDSFSATEIVSLVNHVGGGASMFRTNLPEGSNFSRSLDMDLCQALLKKALHLDWEIEMPQDDALWITGQFPDLDKVPPQEQLLIQIDGKLIDCSRLITKEELLARLFAKEGTYTTLTEICDENFQKWHTPLYWTYPISDSKYDGCYFILVKEGVLVISYDVVDADDHEVFLRESARMSTVEEMSYLMEEWRRYDSELTVSMEALRAYLQRLEAMS